MREGPKDRKMSATQTVGKQYESKINNLYLFTFKTKKKSFLHKIFTGDEKWIYYDNPVNNKQWLVPEQSPLFPPKRGIHVKKVML